MIPRKRSTVRARELRRRSTRPEQLLWSALRGGKLTGYKFRRQHRIGPYFADFACIAHKLIIEVDGAGHDIDFLRDERRSVWLGRQGYRVVRFANEDVMRNLEGVVETIRSILMQEA